MFTLESPNTHLDIKGTYIQWESYTSMTKWPVSQIGHNVQNKKKNAVHSPEMKVVVKSWVHSLFVFNFHR